MSKQNTILRFSTAGSVDDGKSSLIGRLLFDSKAVMEDQWSAIERASQGRGSDQVELALLTDGLRAEREQNITIDVAYRYFTTPTRKFIIADTPGHVQYTRNMVTGTSTSNVSVVLIDASKGVLPQSKRHAAISTLLGVEHLVVAVNKMDLVGYSEDVFAKISQDFLEIVRRLNPPHITFIPVSALIGDNVVHPSENMPWYHGPSLLDFLEHVDVDTFEQQAFRLPVQVVIRPNSEFRGFAGRIEGGQVTVGDHVLVASSQVHTTVAGILVADQEAQSAHLGQSVVVTLKDNVDVSRGDLIASVQLPPQSSSRISAIICWLHPSSSLTNQRYIMLHGPRRLSAVIETIENKIDIESYDHIPADRFEMNDIGKAIIHASSPIHFDAYRENKALGSFVLVDPGNNATVAAGMIEKRIDEPVKDATATKGNVVTVNLPYAEVLHLSHELRPFFATVIAVDPALPNLPEFVRQLSQQGFGVLLSQEIDPVSLGLPFETVGGAQTADRILEALNTKPEDFTWDI